MGKVPDLGEEMAKLLEADVIRGKRFHLLLHGFEFVHAPLLAKGFDAVPIDNVLAL